LHCHFVFISPPYFLRRASFQPYAAAYATPELSRHFSRAAAAIIDAAAALMLFAMILLMPATPAPPPPPAPRPPDCHEFSCLMTRRFRYACRRQPRHAAIAAFIAALMLIAISPAAVISISPLQAFAFATLPPIYE